jgi:hypothetical protein
MSPKPLREPPIEPLPNGRDLASRHPNGINTNEEKGVGEEDREFASLTTSPDLLTECYLRAREKFGEPGAGVVAKAARVDLVPPEEIFEAIEDAPDVQEFAYVLWRP